MASDLGKRSCHSALSSFIVQRNKKPGEDNSNAHAGRGMRLEKSRGPTIGRRAALKGAVATAGVAVGAGAIRGFPTIWAQNIKDVVLNHAGPPVTAIPRIAEQASKDLGFTVHMQTTENADLLNRFLSQSSAIDCADVSIVFLRYLVGRNILQTIPLAKVKDWEQTIPLFTKGIYPDGREASKQGVAPYTNRPYR